MRIEHISSNRPVNSCYNYFYDNRVQPVKNIEKQKASFKDILQHSIVKYRKFKYAYEIVLSKSAQNYLDNGIEYNQDILYYTNDLKLVKNIL
jgi:hypothetical protein